MSLEVVKELMRELEKSSLQTLSCEFAGIKVHLEKPKGEVVQNILPVSHETGFLAEEEKKISGKLITSPIVGTFYVSPQKGGEPYVAVGQKVKKGEIVCIVEAMKLMNEIESEFDGEIAEVLVQDGTMVEYNQPLFVVR